MRLDIQTLTRDDSVVRGDPDDLRIAITNLLDNAVKYSPNEKDIQVILTDEAGYVLVRVKDKGSGIAGQNLKRIFRRFYRVPLRSMAKVKGTGLGLFIVKSIARRHNSTWSSYSGRQPTTTFGFW